MSYSTRAKTMSDRKIHRVMVMEEDDVSVIGGDVVTFGGHCQLLFEQLHEETLKSGHIYLCVPVSRADYEWYLDGRRPQPEWLFDYFNHTALAFSKIRRRAYIFREDPPTSEAEAADRMEVLTRIARVEPTFYLPRLSGDEGDELWGYWCRVLSLNPFARGETEN